MLSETVKRLLSKYITTSNLDISLINGTATLEDVTMKANGSVSKGSIKKLVITLDYTRLTTHIEARQCHVKLARLPTVNASESDEGIFEMDVDVDGLEIEYHDILVTIPQVEVRNGVMKAKNIVISKDRESVELMDCVYDKEWSAEWIVIICQELLVKVNRTQDISVWYQNELVVQTREGVFGSIDIVITDGLINQLVSFHTTITGVFGLISKDVNFNKNKRKKYEIKLINVKYKQVSISLSNTVINLENEIIIDSSIKAVHAAFTGAFKVNAIISDPIQVNPMQFFTPGSVECIDWVGSEKGGGFTGFQLPCNSSIIVKVDTMDFSMVNLPDTMDFSLGNLSEQEDLFASAVQEFSAHYTVNVYINAIKVSLFDYTLIASDIHSFIISMHRMWINVKNVQVFDGDFLVLSRRFQNDIPCVCLSVVDNVELYMHNLLFITNKLFCNQSSMDGNHSSIDGNNSSMVGNLFSLFSDYSSMDGNHPSIVGSVEFKAFIYTSMVQWNAFKLDIHSSEFDHVHCIVENCKLYFNDLLLLKMTNLHLDCTMSDQPKNHPKSTVKIYLQDSLINLDPITLNEILDLFSNIPTPCTPSNTSTQVESVNVFADVDPEAFTHQVDVSLVNSLKETSKQYISLLNDEIDGFTLVESDTRVVESVTHSRLHLINDYLCKLRKTRVPLGEFSIDFNTCIHLYKDKGRDHANKGFKEEYHKQGNKEDYHEKDDKKDNKLLITIDIKQAKATRSEYSDYTSSSILITLLSCTDHASKYTEMLKLDPKHTLQDTQGTLEITLTESLLKESRLSV